MRQLHCLHPHQLMLLFVHVDIDNLILELMGKHGRLLQVVAQQLALDVPLLLSKRKLHGFRIDCGDILLLSLRLLVVSSVRHVREVLLQVDIVVNCCCGIT